MSHTLPFEKPIVDLTRKLQALRDLAEDDPSFAHECHRLEEKASRLTRAIFADLSSWQKVQLSRHPARPYTRDYLGHLFDGYLELRGDRRFGDDGAIVGGLARFRGRAVVVLGHQKGRGAKENIARNFGMPHPEGYRKAMRLYDIADRFGLPVITFIDTPGAHPGIGAEERGQSEAIGACIARMATLRVPVVATIIGEGGSGGALALGVANRVNVLEYSTYSVISPEGCASILWKDGKRASEAAKRLRITADDLHRMGVVDDVIEEPPGGAHRDPADSARRVGEALARALNDLAELSPDAIAQERYRRFRNLGMFSEDA